MLYYLFTYFDLAFDFPGGVNAVALRESQRSGSSS